MIAFALVSVVVLIAFALAWRLMPAGWLTAATGSFSAISIALYEAVGEQMPALKAVLPPEYQPWLVVTFLLLTVAARFRSKATEQ